MPAGHGDGAGLPAATCRDPRDHGVGAGASQFPGFGFGWFVTACLTERGFDALTWLSHRL